jgi:hypothetical protein
MKKLRIVSILLCVLTILQIALVSCSNSGDGKDTVQTTTAISDNADGTPVETELKPYLPEVNMNGKEIRMLTSGWGQADKGVVLNDIVSAEITGEPLNDAVYERQATIEQTYNCKIIQLDDIDFRNAALSLQNSVMANDNDYDVAMIMGTVFSTLIVGGYLLELDELPYMDVTQPW